MPAEKMMKWGFLVKHERWLAVDGFSVTVTPPKPRDKPSSAPWDTWHRPLTDTRCVLVCRCFRSALSRM